MTFTNHSRIEDQPLVRTWLYFVAALVFCMVIVGGATRLTDSGLSITEWQPLLGAIPPFSAAAWQEAFDKYKAIPEYQIINKGMSLEAFKGIYWWEWSHRFLGRVIGLSVLIPLLLFWWRGLLSRDVKRRGSILFALILSQGLLGWLMVKSGLTDRTDVSQYRLAAHLSLALFILSFTLWTAWRTKEEAGPAWSSRDVWPFALVVAVFVQIGLGGLVAGMDAGMAYNTWPLMDGRLVPQGLFVMSPAWINFFENAMTVQFTHRVTAYVVLALAVANLVLRAHTPASRQAALLFVGAVLLQAAIGVWTLLMQVPLSLGLLHQAGAMIVLAAVLNNLWIARREAVRPNERRIGAGVPQPMA
ncbi:MAG: COX15/CtaA family protein [Hyphomicrobiales bacterium]